MCLTYLSFSLSVYSVNITRSKGKCSYVFLVHLDYLQQFDLSQSQQSVLPIARNGSHIPVSLQWAYNYLPGSSANDSSPYCSYIINGDYKCHCPQGQGGNPYLRIGCQGKIIKLNLFPTDSTKALNQNHKIWSWYLPALRQDPILTEIWTYMYTICSFAESPQCASCKGDCFASASDFNDVICFPSKTNRAHLLAVVLGTFCTNFTF